MLLLTNNRSLLSVRPDFEFQAAPNPALNEVSFSSDAILKKVKIFSVTGQKMLEKENLDIRLEKSLNNQDYQIQIIFDDQETSIAEVEFK